MVLPQTPTTLKGRAKAERVHLLQHAKGKTSSLCGHLLYKGIMISSKDNRKVAARSHFKINRELIRILGAELHSVTKQRSGDLMGIALKQGTRKISRRSLIVTTSQYFYFVMPRQTLTDLYIIKKSKLEPFPRPVPYIY